MNKKNLSIKGTAIRSTAMLVAVLFLFTEVLSVPSLTPLENAYAQEDNSNHSEHSSISLTGQDLAQTPSQSMVQGGEKPAVLSGQPLIDEGRWLPPELGTISEAYRATIDHRPETTDSLSPRERDGVRGKSLQSPVSGLQSAKTIVFVQDAHDSLEAQENIAKIIKLLTGQYGVRTVFEEGYEGPVPTDELFGFIKDPAIRQKVSWFFLDKLRLRAAEYAHIVRRSRTDYRPQTIDYSKSKQLKNLTAYPLPLTTDWQLIGADSLKLHQENIDQYRLSAEKKKTITKDLKALEKELRALADSRFPKEFREWLKIKEQFDAKKLDLFTYLARTMPRLSGQLNTARHREESRRGDAAISYDKNEIASPPARNDATEAAVPLLQFILAAMKSNDPVVIEKAKHIDAREIFAELIKLEQAMADAWLGDATDKELFNHHKTIQLLKRLNTLEVTQEEYTALLDHRPQTTDNRPQSKQSFKPWTVDRGPGLVVDTQGLGKFIHKTAKKPLVLSKQWERNIQEAVRFYEIAAERDGAIEKSLERFFEKGLGTRDSNLEKTSPESRGTSPAPAVLVYGGFHKENIKRILEAKGISYIVVSPRITKPSPRHEEYYKQLMTKGFHKFELPFIARTATAPAGLFEANPKIARAEVRAVYEAIRGGASVGLADRMIGKQVRAEVRSFNPAKPQGPAGIEGMITVEGDTRAGYVFKKGGETIGRVLFDPQSNYYEEARQMAGILDASGIPAEADGSFIRFLTCEPAVQVHAGERPEIFEKYIFETRMNQEFHKFGVRYRFKDASAWGHSGDRIKLTGLPEKAPWIMDEIRPVDQSSPIRTTYETMPVVTSLFDPKGLVLFRDSDGAGSSQGISLGMVRREDGLIHPAAIKRGFISIEELIAIQILGNHLGILPEFYGVIKDPEGKIIGYAMSLIAEGEGGLSAGSFRDIWTMQRRIKKYLYGIYLRIHSKMLTRRNKIVGMDAGDFSAWKEFFDHYISGMRVNPVAPMPKERIPRAEVRGIHGGALRNPVQRGTWDRSLIVSEDVLQSAVSVSKEKVPILQDLEEVQGQETARKNRKTDLLVQVVSRVSAVVRQGLLPYILYDIWQNGLAHFRRSFLKTKDPFYEPEKFLFSGMLGAVVGSVIYLKIGNRLPTHAARAEMRDKQQTIDQRPETRNQNQSLSLQSKKRSEMRAAIPPRAGVDGARSPDYPTVVEVYEPRAELALLVNSGPSGHLGVDMITRKFHWDDKPLESFGFGAASPPGVPAINLLWEDLEKQIPPGMRKGPVHVYSFHNLFYSDWFTAFDGKTGTLFCRKGEPFENRTYNMFVVWKDKNRKPSSEDLVFRPVPRGPPGKVAVFRKSDKHKKNDLSGKIKFAVFGQRVIHQGQNVPLEKFALQFQDIFQLYRFPQFIRREGDKTRYGLSFGAEEMAEWQRNDSGKFLSVVRAGGLMEIDLDRYFGRAPFEGEASLDQGAKSLGLLQQQAFDVFGYSKVAWPQDPSFLKEGEYAIQGARVVFKLKPYPYPHNLIGVTQSGRVVAIVFTGDKMKGLGVPVQQLSEKCRAVYAEKYSGAAQDPLVAVHLLANSRDAIQRTVVQGVGTVTAASADHYPRSTAALAIAANPFRSEARAAAQGTVSAVEAKQEVQWRRVGPGEFAITGVVTNPKLVGNQREGFRRMVVLKVRYQGKEYFAKMAQDPFSEKNIIVSMANIFSRIASLDSPSFNRANAFLEFDIRQPVPGLDPSILGPHKIIVMEDLPPGRPLSNFSQGMPPRKALEIISQAAHVLKVFHEKIGVHADIKPENFWQTRDGRIILFDYDLAFQSNLEFGGRNLWAFLPPNYSSPARKDSATLYALQSIIPRPFGPEEDLYALTKVLLFLIAGKEKFDEIYQSKVDDYVKAVQQQSPLLARVLSKGAGGKESGYRNADDFIADIFLAIVEASPDFKPNSRPPLQRRSPSPKFRSEVRLVEAGTENIKGSFPSGGENRAEVREKVSEASGDVRRSEVVAASAEGQIKKPEGLNVRSKLRKLGDVFKEKSFFVGEKLIQILFQHINWSEACVERLNKLSDFQFALSVTIVTGLLFGASSMGAMAFLLYVLNIPPMRVFLKHHQKMATIISSMSFIGVSLFKLISAENSAWFFLLEMTTAVLFWKVFWGDKGFFQEYIETHPHRLSFAGFIDHYLAFYGIYYLLGIVIGGFSGLFFTAFSHLLIYVHELGHFLPGKWLSRNYPKDYRPRLQYFHNPPRVTKLKIPLALSVAQEFLITFGGPLSEFLFIGGLLGLFVSGVLPSIALSSKLLWPVIFFHAIKSLSFTEDNFRIFFELKTRYIARSIQRNIPPILSAHFHPANIQEASRKEGDKIFDKLTESYYFKTSEGMYWLVKDFGQEEKDFEIGEGSGKKSGSREFIRANFLQTQVIGGEKYLLYKITELRLHGFEIVVGGVLRTNFDHQLKQANTRSEMRGKQIGTRHSGLVPRDDQSKNKSLGTSPESQGVERSKALGNADHSQQTTDPSPTPDRTEVAKVVEDILSAPAPRPEPETMMRLIEQGLMEEDIHRAASRAVLEWPKWAKEFSEGRVPEKDFYEAARACMKKLTLPRTFKEVDNLIPYTVAIVEALYEQYGRDPNNTMLFLGRDAESLYDAYRVMARLNGWETQARLFPGSTPFWRNHQNGHFYGQFFNDQGINLEAFHRGKKFVLVDTGFQGTMGEALWDAFENAYQAKYFSNPGYNFNYKYGPENFEPVDVAMRHVRIVLVSALKALKRRQLKVDLPLPSEAKAVLFPKVASIDQRKISDQLVDKNDIAYWVAIAHQLLPKFHGSYDGYRSQGQFSYPSWRYGFGYRDEVLLSSQKEIEEPREAQADIVNPYAALLVQHRFIKGIKEFLEKKKMVAQSNTVLEERVRLASRAEMPLKPSSRTSQPASDDSRRAEMRGMTSDQSSEERGKPVLKTYDSAILAAPEAKRSGVGFTTEGKAVRAESRVRTQEEWQGIYREFTAALEETKWPYTENTGDRHYEPFVAELSGNKGWVNISWLRGITFPNQLSMGLFGSTVSARIAPDGKVYSEYSNDEITWEDEFLEAIVEGFRKAYQTRRSGTYDQSEVDAFLEQRRMEKENAEAARRDFLSREPQLLADQIKALAGLDKEGLFRVARQKRWVSEESSWKVQSDWLKEVLRRENFAEILDRYVKITTGEVHRSESGIYRDAIALFTKAIELAGEEQRPALTLRLADWQYRLQKLIDSAIALSREINQVHLPEDGPERSETRLRSEIREQLSNARRVKRNEKKVPSPQPLSLRTEKWMDATVPQNVFFAIDGKTLESLGTEKGDRRWNEILALKGIYGKDLNIYVTGTISKKAEAKILELASFGERVFTDPEALQLPENAEVIYFTDDTTEDVTQALPDRMKQKVKAVFQGLREADFIAAAELSLSSYLEEALSQKSNIRQFIADRLGFNATRALQTLFEAYVVISSAA